MNLLITGGSGFIGKNIIEHFSNGYEIFAPSHKELDLLDEDAVSDYFNKHKIDIVIHCAIKPGHRNASDHTGLLYSNAKMFFNLVRNESKYNKMIYFSSGMVYDPRFYQPKMKESYFDYHVPEDESAFAKYIISKYIESKKNIIELRVFGIFGKYEDYAIRFISNLICKAIYDLPLTMNQNRLFDYIYIKDLMPILEFFMNDNPKENVFNVTPDKSAELLDIAKIIKKTSGKDLPIIVAKEGFGPTYSGDNSRLRNELSKLEFTGLESAVRELYDWYLENKKSIDKEKLLIDK